MGKYIFPELQRLFLNEEIQFILSKEIKQAVVQFVEETVVENIINSLIDELTGIMNSEDVRLQSPAELKVFDSQGRVTGLANGKVVSEIPRSIYDNGMVTILFPSSPHRYEVVGIGKGSYGLKITRIGNGERNSVNLTNIDTTTNTVHEYSVDWAALSKGEKGVTMQIDSNGDGTFEEIKKLSQEGTAFLCLDFCNFSQWIAWSSYWGFND